MPVIQEPDQLANCAYCQYLKTPQNGIVWQLEPPCGHSFHKKCLRRHLKNGSAKICALCRATIASIDQSRILADDSEDDSEDDSQTHHRSEGNSGDPSEIDSESEWEADWESESESNSNNSPQRTSLRNRPEVPYESEEDCTSDSFSDSPDESLDQPHIPHRSENEPRTRWGTDSRNLSERNSMIRSESDSRNSSGRSTYGNRSQLQHVMAVGSRDANHDAGSGTRYNNQVYDPYQRRSRALAHHQPEFEVIYRWSSPTWRGMIRNARDAALAGSSVDFMNNPAISERVEELYQEFKPLPDGYEENTPSVPELVQAFRVVIHQVPGHHHWGWVQRYFAPRRSSALAPHHRPGTYSRSYTDSDNDSWNERPPLSNRPRKSQGSSNHSGHYRDTATIPPATSRSHMGQGSRSRARHETEPSGYDLENSSHRATHRATRPTSNSQNAASSNSNRSYDTIDRYAYLNLRPRNQIINGE